MEKERRTSREIPFRRRPLSIGLLQEEQSPFDPSQLNKLFNQLGEGAVQLKELTFTSDTSKVLKDKASLYSSKQLGWNGVFKTPYLKEFQQQPFDLLISYYTEDTIALDAMTALSKAMFKVGIAPGKEELNDLTIVVQKGQESVFAKELINYLKILKYIA